MTPEKWQELMNECSELEKVLLRLYRAYVFYPWRVYAVFFLFCLFSVIQSGIGLSDVGGLAFVLGVGPTFFFFSSNTPFGLRSDLKVFPQTT